jgi:predicted nucleotidyltransferase
MLEDNAGGNCGPIVPVVREGEPRLKREQARAYARALKTLNELEIRYAVAGAFATHFYTGLWRDTKDLDIFIKPEDAPITLDALKAEGFKTEVREKHWLAKAKRSAYLVDLIFGMANGMVEFDDEWLACQAEVSVAGVKAPVIRLEELITSKVYIAVRDRFDGADILHLIRAVKGQVDWERILERLRQHRNLLLWHFILFDFVYPAHAEYLPRELMKQLFNEFHGTPPAVDRNRFMGTLLDAFSFAADVKDWGYPDARKLMARFPGEDQ